MILITGGSGFLGKPLCEKLVTAGQEVLDLSLEASDSGLYPTLQVDITDRAALRRVFEQHSVDTVIHYASLLHTVSRLNPKLAVEVNVIGAYNLLDEALQAGVKRFIFGSTVDSIGYIAPDGRIIDESVEIQPGDFYGETKRFIEKLGITYAQVHNLEFASVRIPNAVGPGKPISTSAWRMKIFNLLKTGGEIQFVFKKDEILPLAHIADCADQVTLLALAKKPAHNVYNLPSESWKMADLASQVEQIGNNVKISFGQKKVDFCPPYISSQRFCNEFHYEPTSLVTHLEMTMEAR